MINLYIHAIDYRCKTSSFYNGENEYQSCHGKMSCQIRFYIRSSTIHSIHSSIQSINPFNPFLQSIHRLFLPQVYYIAENFRLPGDETPSTNQGSTTHSMMEHTSVNRKISSSSRPSRKCSKGSVGHLEDTTELAHVP